MPRSITRNSHGTAEYGIAAKTQARPHVSADGTIDLIVSKEFAKTVEWAGYGGYEFRGKPDGFDEPPRQRRRSRELRPIVEGHGARICQRGQAIVFAGFPRPDRDRTLQGPFHPPTSLRRTNLGGQQLLRTGQN